MNAAGMGITVSRNENKRIEFKNPPMAGYISLSSLFIPMR